jgi:hypothetical protein
MNALATEDVLAYFRAVYQSDDLELDESTSNRGLGNTCRGEDPGTWVRAWVWCYDSDVQAWLDAKNSNTDPRPSLTTS